LPERFSFKSEEKIFQYIRSVFNDILVHDILNKNSIQNVTNFYNFANFIMSNSAKRLSVKKAENLINDVYKTKYDRTTIANFINYLIESFLIVKIDYLNSTTMDILKNSRRYYANDIGLKNSLSEKNIFSKGRTIENIIFIELLNRGYTVNGFCMYDTNSKVDENSSTAKEIDFIAKKNNKSFNIQVTINLVEENYSREIGNFKFVKNGFENILLSMDKNLDRIPGVRTVNIID
jgi:predicted AAA+ superfamily ATPase